MQSRSPRRPRGITIALVLQVLVVISILAVALGAVGIRNLNQVRFSEERSTLIHMANGGLNEVMDLLYNTPDYGTTANPQTGVTAGTYATRLSQAQYWFTFDTAVGQPYSTNNLLGNTTVTGYNGLTVPAYGALAIVTAGKFGSNDPRNQVRLGAIIARVWPYAIAADGQIDVSDVRTVGPDPAVRSNEAHGAGVSSINIEADTVMGSSYSRDGFGSIDISGNPKGRMNFNQPPIPLPDVPVLNIVASYDNDSATHPFGGPADFCFEGNQTGNSDPDGTLHIGSVTIPPPPAGHQWNIHVNGSLRFNGGLDLNRRIHFFVSGTFEVNGGGGLDQIDTNGTMPASAPFPGATTFNDNFIFANRILYDGGVTQTVNLFAETEIHQNGSSDYRGLLYVHNGEIELNGTQDFKGVIISRGSGGASGDVDAPRADVTYDPSVLTAVESRYGISFGSQSKMRILSWWRMD